MLRRDSSHRPDRRKSTSSLHSSHESINLETARHHAHTAAMLAFLRAQQRSSTDSSQHADGLSRNNSTNTSNHVFSARESLPQQSVGPEPGRGVRRQQSVRFVGPNGMERRASLSKRASQATIHHQLSSATLRPMAITTNTPVPAAYLPPSRSSSLGKASFRKVAEALITPNAFQEYYTQEDDVASTPSSYRRIRRSKSMFSPLKAPSIYYTNGGPTNNPESFLNGGHVRSYSHTPTSQPLQPALRAPKSMSVLNDHAQAAVDRDRNRAEVQQARDIFFAEKQKQRLREQPSFLFRSRTQRQEKPFRKSVRTDSSNSYGMPVRISSANEQGEGSTLKTAARKVSKTIKDKLRRVFGRSSKEEPFAIPNQQVEARETHVRHYNGDVVPTPELFEGFSDIPHPDERSLLRVASRVPSLHSATSNQQLRSRAGSVKSFKSDLTDERSRASSLSTGVHTNGNTPQSHQNRTPIERDHHRLSVINENGTHRPSSSHNRSKRKSNQCSAYPKINSKNTPPVPPPVGQFKIQFASNPSPNAPLNSTQDLPGSIVPSPHSTGLSRNPILQSSEGRSPATIRQVVPSLSSRVPESSSNSDDVFSPEVKTYLSSGLSPQKNVNGKLVEPKIVHEARSTFFGGSTITTSRKTSPFRRAMAESHEIAMLQSQDYALPMRNPLYQVPALAVSTDTLRQGSSQSEHYSESIYSRTTSGRTPAAANSATSLPLIGADIPELPLRPTTPGDAVIIDRVVYRPVGSIHSSHRITSSAGSQEWKTWMSSEVAKLERAKENKSTPTYVNYAMPTMPKAYRTGHVREPAQINDDEVEVQDTKTYQPLGLIPQNPNILPKKTPQKPPVINSPVIPKAPPLPPAIPARSPLRKKLSKASLKSVKSVASSENNRPKHALHKRRMSAGAKGNGNQESQKMVENFLSVRRKRIASESDDVSGVFL